MVTARRYIGRYFRKPPFWKGWRHFLRLVLFPAVVAVVLMLAVRALLLTQYSLAADSASAELLAGDRVLVNRVAYGFRVPLSQIFGERVWGGAIPDTGDLVAARAPGGVVIDRVTALPGDTVRFPREGILPAGVFRVGNVLVNRWQIVGRVEFVTFSVCPDVPFYKSLRADRFFISVK